MPINPFRLYKTILTKEIDILNRARIAILVQGLLTFFLMGAVLLVLCIIRQHVFSERICILMTLFASGIALLLTGISWRMIAHFFILCVSYLIWSNLIFYNLYFLVAIQYILIIVTCSYYILGRRWGLFYSIANIIPFMILIVHYVQKGSGMLEQDSNPLAFCVIFIFNFILLIIIHYFFLNGFRASNDNEKALIADLEKSLVALQLLVEKKDEFLNIATHEFKTPITSIKASMQSLQRLVSRNESMKESVPLITIASRQTEKLAIIANDLVDASKVQSGKLSLNKTVFSLPTVILECIREIQYQANDYQFVFEPDLQCDILADRTRIEQVLCNLLTNAVKYSPQSKIIKLNIECVEEHIKVLVQDQGIGIPDNNLPFIFDRFFRVHSSSQRFPGLGLGLFISAEIVKQHSGEIGVDSKEGEGSLFWFTLPVLTHEG